jgi:hypothetical protein
MPLMGFTIRVADDAVQWEILSALMQDPGVAFVEQDQIVYAFRHQLPEATLDAAAAVATITVITK